MSDLNTPELIVKDLIEQMGCLLYCRDCLLNNIEIHDPDSKAVPKDYLEIVKRTKKISKKKFTVTELEKNIQVIEQKIVFCGKQFLKEIIETLKIFVEMDVTKFVINEKKKKKRKKQNKIDTSSSPRKGLKPQEGEIKSTYYYVIQTIHSCLKDLALNNMSYKFSQVPQWLVINLFHKIETTMSASNRHVAQRIIGLLSIESEHLKTLTEQYIEFF
ncbi:hypothetical protein M0812_00420 [Anaeramoeba flamelloides]|uniref:Uncharacterized protein n=1 Tax=Anaeramoeba flamelloides TaxID=1746091 RepID=A0AAV8A5A1_9EUKA|nr:hypothetical protein M0812_00420 [Anaeramoeba flamelloides]